MGDDWRPPDELDEYRLVRRLGRGATGEVYLAHDQLLDRPVAVKFVPRATDPAARSRVFDEARAIARLQHPNVVAIYRVAELDGSPYLVSEYIRGRPLDQLERPVPWQQVLPLAIDLASGLAAAHRGGVLHRDVKPANAIVTEEGRGKLLDFGLARVFHGTEPAGEPAREPESRECEITGVHLAAIDATTSARPVTVASIVASGSDDSFDPAAPDRSLPVGGVGPRAAGTPLYMAPELWRGEPATRRTDLYALGVLLYELSSGTAPHRGIPLAELGEAIQQRDVPPLRSAAPGIDPGFAAIVDRLLARDPAARFASADALVLALEECTAGAPGTELPEGNPYRGLAVFDAAHGALFFGRRGEIRELVDRVTHEPLVVVGGDSGTGKSSLCRAGVLPALVERGGWTRVDLVPGRHPTRALGRALSTWAGRELDLVEGPSAIARELQRIAEAEHRNLLLFVDQLEELLTLADPEEAKQVSVFLAGLGEHAPAIRVLATARSDFLSRLGSLPALRDAMSRALYFLLPLTPDKIREAIVRPAAAKGVRFETEALVDLLVAQTEQAPGGLPLLQFTLAELWDARDVAAKTIQSASLDALGGVAGALARHADRLLAGLPAIERDAARRLLLRLITATGTRARRTEIELLGEAGERRPEEQRALEVLVRGRIVVASDVQQGMYEIAHEALLASWSTLEDWRRQNVADHAVRLRLEQAAATWDRMGRPRDLLWAPRQLRETRELDRESLAPRETTFLTTSRRVTVRRRVIALAAAAAVIAGIAIVTLRLRARARAELEAVIAQHTDRARIAFDEAGALARQRDAARLRAFELYDAHRWPEAEEVWSEAEALRGAEAARYRAASTSFENALSLDPSRVSLREAFADLLFSRLQRAERDRDVNLVDELAGRLAAHDPEGRFRTALAADARVELDVTPRTAKVWIEGPAREPVIGRTFTAPPGQTLLTLEAPGHAPVRLPLLLARGRTSQVTLALPPQQAVPRGMIYVPAGSFLFGSADHDDLRRSFLNAAPLHEVHTPAYWIARHEVTFGEWIEYLDELPADERKRRTPSAITTQNALELVELAPRRWRLELTPTTRTYVVAAGEPLVYEKRDRRASQDWLRFPVTAISFEDAVAYATWLDRTKRIPGARLCDEHEWERAARGADGRTFPHGETLEVDDANIDVTYGREPLAFGPDEVGSHPRSRSVFGVDDLAGNVWEWTRSVAIPDTPVYRGGGYYNAALSSRSVNREPGEPTQRNVLIGIRLCVSASPRPP